MKNLFDFNGRLGRQGYIVSAFKILGIMILSLIVFGIIGYFLKISLLLLVVIISAYLMFANTAKRAHDLNLPTWTAIVVVAFMNFSVNLGDDKMVIIPAAYLMNLLRIPTGAVNLITQIGTLVIFLFILYLLFKKGDENTNQFGENPIKQKIIISEDQKKKIAEEYIANHKEELPTKETPTESNQIL